MTDALRAPKFHCQHCGDEVGENVVKECKTKHDWTRAQLARVLEHEKEFFSEGTSWHYWEGRLDQWDEDHPKTMREKLSKCLKLGAVLLLVWVLVWMFVSMRPTPSNHVTLLTAEDWRRDFSRCNNERDLLLQEVANLRAYIAAKGLLGPEKDGGHD